mmetsp:Transcript_15891/g.35388  ORF Transcript_15891/g.35388 Transcript_15891/m.35388 type:complete len:243 (+) Transcript_15891:91-819(+)|eukprot:CAMPEP_0204389394 /NCGR_PEP_ID=MMETSP0469-20131031/60089_1 /ASSEMBLY_ACC=CAM_ASM_000384 /TAXON_ID=2969 /ORGANISM="Oxyrrhis marina" /LENGTH=242 /DNA_ID=CAMNT_0051383079 /DNA_START=51 /DNA_END=779 /DNA_ORIENTATION=+
MPAGAWTEDEMKLWLPKDQEACDKWKAQKEQEWEDGKLKEKYPTKEELDAWTAKTCQGSIDKALALRTNPRVYFQVSIGGEDAGRVVMQLREDKVPKTAENFKQLCLKPEGEGYKGSIFHRIIPQFMCQGGDFTNHNGTGGKSIYGEKFEDENFILKHTGPGILSMANAGPNTNGSQFFLCTEATPWLDGKHVVFGKVTEGLDVMKKMEAEGSAGDGKTKNEVKILDCGEVPLAEWPEVKGA